jgi:hypothetical protein
MDQLRSQLGEAAGLSLRRANFDLNVAPFDIAEVTQGLAVWPHQLWPR